jgi:type IV pilus assembly protein PilE
MDMDKPCQPMPPRADGFTLIELLVAIAVVAILASIAVASYEFALVKSRRGAAQGCLGEAAQYMERFHTSNMRYDQDLDGNAVTLPTCSSDVSPYSDVTLVAADLAADAYTLQAAPKGRQATAEKQCGTMTINQVGTKTPETGCW